MVSLFGRGFDSLQLHLLLKCKPLTFKQLAASLCPASPVFSVFGDALGDAKRILLNPIWQLFSYFLTQFQIIKKLKNALLLRFYLLFSFLLSFLPFTCFYMKLQMWVVFWFCHSTRKYPFLHEIAYFDSIAMIKENPFMLVLSHGFICFYMDLQILVRGDLP